MFTKSHPAPKPQADEGTSHERPAYRAWIVLDASDDGEPVWIDLTGLWPTQKGDGLSGAIRKPLPMLGGHAKPRLVVLPAKERPSAQS